MSEMAARARATVAASIPEWGTGTATLSLRGLGELLRVPARFLRCRSLPHHTIPYSAPASEKPRIIDHQPVGVDR